MSKKFLVKVLALTICAGLTLQPVTVQAAETTEKEIGEIVVEEQAEATDESTAIISDNESETQTEVDVVVPEDENKTQIETDKMQNANPDSDDMEWEVEILNISPEPPSEEAVTGVASPNSWTYPDFDLSVSEYTFPEFDEYPLDENRPSLRVNIKWHSTYNKYFNDSRPEYGRRRFTVNWPEGKTNPHYFTITPNQELEAGSYEDTIKIWANNAWGDLVGEYYITVRAKLNSKPLLNTIEATSNIADIFGYENETKHPDFTVTSGKEVFFDETATYPYGVSKSYWKKKNGDKWENYTEDIFTLGTYQYYTFIKLDPKYIPSMKILGGTNVVINGQSWKAWDYYFAEGQILEVCSPELECNYPELSNVRLEGDVLSWDPVEDEDLWYYVVTVGKYESVQYECSIDLKEICNAIKLYGGTHTVEIVAYDYNREPLTQTYKFEYDYDGPMPKERTTISDIVMNSTIKGMFKEGYPSSNIISSGDMPWIDCSDWWWEIYGEDGWSQYTDYTFGEGTYRYKTKIRIAQDYIDQYMLDPELKLTVDKNEWTSGDIKFDYNDEVEYKEFTSPEYVLPLPEKNKITSISASCDDLSDYVIKDAELALPEFTNIDREEVYIRSTWCLFENGEPMQPKETTFTPGKWHLIAAVKMKEDYEEDYELEKTTTLTVNGIEWTNITGKSDPYFGVYFLSPEYVIEDDEPVIAGGTWSSKWGSTYYETEEGEKLTGIQKINGEYYLFSKNGILQCNVFHEENGQKYYFGSEGKMKIGWFDKWSSTYYADENGVIQTGFVDIDEDTYYFKADGKLTRSTWITVGDAKYYTKTTGKLAKSETITKWGKKYTFDENGVLIQ
nr:hypothetical protein [uncultured Butyrivibrio sp.]